jgi:hypothetical protein
MMRLPCVCAAQLLTAPFSSDTISVQFHRSINTATKLCKMVNWQNGKDNANELAFSTISQFFHFAILLPRQ